ncbi:hypothetical protein [Winogradskyella sp. 3972H.M.0a.05]|uniref:hypothetical protein n=1 Tax=Winogradskyella sp. 3972H.M.0a.05 TaxID=2950277 RepID=UPI003395C3C9
MMRYLLGLFCLSFLLFGCDDGDVITVEFAFDDTFDTCGEMVLFKTTSDPSESLSVFISGLTESDLTTFGENLVDYTETMTEIRSLSETNTLNYRRYDATTISGDDLFCNEIPSNITIISDEEVTSGTVEFTTTATDDDNDGIPWQDEDANEDGDNNPATNPTDTDNDGIPNYLDVDDDGDNVLTRDEDTNEDGDNNPFTNPLNTDGEDQPDYLDTDDDNDGVLTRDEESILADNNPTNDITSSEIGPDYLNPNVSVSVPATEFRTHQITRSFTSSVELLNVTFAFVVNDMFDFGTTGWTSLTIEKATIFN